MPIRDPPSQAARPRLYMLRTMVLRSAKIASNGTGCQGVVLGRNAQRGGEGTTAWRLFPSSLFPKMERVMGTRVGIHGLGRGRYGLSGSGQTSDQTLVGLDKATWIKGKIRCTPPTLFPNSKG